MQVFEFYFNPKSKEDTIFDSFAFEPENIWERKVGRLYMVGQLSHALPPNLKLLENISYQIKGEYYRATERSSEAALRESLKKANEFLAEETRKGVVNWLGNLDFAVLSLKEDIFNFATTGNISVFLLRAGEVTDINQSLRIQEIDPYPLKIFGNTVSGKITLHDRIVVLTKEAAEFFKQSKIFKEIISLEKVDDKKLKKIFKGEGELYQQTSGVCFLIDLNEEDFLKEEKITLEKKAVSFSIWRFLGTRFKKDGKKPSLKAKEKIKEEPGPKGKISIPVLNFRPKISILSKIGAFRFSKEFKKNLLLVLILAAILSLGGKLANIEKKNEMEKAQAVLFEVQQKIKSAQQAVSLKNEMRANLLYQDAWKKILPLVRLDSPVYDKANLYKDSIESQLRPLNKVENMVNPELVFDFTKIQFVPLHMVTFDNFIYLFTPLSPDIYRLKPEEKGGNFIEFDEKFNLGTLQKNKGYIILFQRPNKIFSFKGEKFYKSLFLYDPYPDYQFTNIASYDQDLYFLDSKKGDIVKYRFDETRSALPAVKWLAKGEDKPVGAISMAVDGSVWIMTKDNGIERYSAGILQQKLNLNFFPYLESPTQIFTLDTLPYLYILEPSQNRIVILKKNGEMVKQFRSEKFDILKDFSVSRNGKTIYLLNGTFVYKVGL